ncbi:hypothetical protein TrLO_g10742 [Triparma laevis f. longispina]|uniref:Signal recognition particle receptor subunit beta n=1 Tax=Triparma laevis f. longispina TaxID=1714387 RepID=A0A9W7DXK2_9STRA|nr:hypothetical protein TrLO_g10742 [Triparma laevis f. longispina]
MSSSNDSSSSSSSVLTPLRLSLTPFLPPPVVSLLNTIDESGSNILNVPELSYTLLLTFLFLLLLNLILKTLISLTSQSPSTTFSSKSRINTLLLGPSSSGKTTLIRLLLNLPPSPTVTTLSPTSYNSGEYGQIIDHPGHRRLNNTVEEYLSTAKKVIVILDR